LLYSALRLHRALPLYRATLTGREASAEKWDASPEMINGMVEMEAVLNVTKNTTTLSQFIYELPPPQLYLPFLRSILRDLEIFNAQVGKDEERKIKLFSLLVPFQPILSRSRVIQTMTRSPTP